MKRSRLAFGALVVLLVVGFPRRAPATIQEQRARLPPPAECQDPVAGIWRSHQYNPMFGDWGQFTLEVHRVPDDPTRLRGVIRSHSWSGGPRDQEPPAPCRPGMLRWVVSMDAEGRATEDGKIEFWGVGAWRLDQQICDRWAGYNLDHFSGTIDPAIQEFQSVNNDGGRSINEPTVFRRTSCFEENAPVEDHPNIVVDPPPLYPDRSGCGC